MRRKLHIYRSQTSTIYYDQGMSNHTRKCQITDHISANAGSAQILLDFSLTVKAATLTFISGCDSAISPAKEGKSGSIYNLVENK